MKTRTILFAVMLFSAVFVSMIGNVSAQDIYEPDNSPMNATLIPTDGTIQSHNFHTSGDRDWVYFTITPGTIYTIETLNLGTFCDTFIELYESDGSTLITSDDDSGPEPLSSRIIWDSTGYPAGDYYVMVEELFSGSGAGYEYDIRVFEGLPAELMAPHSDYGLDSDGDGLFEYLIVNVSVDVTSGGWYDIYAELRDSSGFIFITWTENYTYLSTGSQIVQLYFSGPTIYDSGIDGPYNVSLNLYDSSWYLLGQEEYDTFPYLYTDFEMPSSFEPPHSDYGLDTDGDGYFNYLVVNVSVNISVAGDYQVNSDLWDEPWMMWITWTNNFTYLNSGSVILQLYFNGRDLYDQGIDGPYNITLDLWDDIGTWLDYDEYLTGAYTYDQFQPPPANLYPPHDDYGLDTDGDGYFNFLVVNVSVNVTTAGNFILEGDLWDETWMMWITFTDNYTFVNSGIQIIQLEFDGRDIYSRGIDGPYNVSMDLYDEFWNWLDNDEYLTNSYTYNQFQPPPALIEPPHDDYGLDTNGDGYFDFLVVNVTVNVTTAGLFRLYGNLFDQDWFTWITSFGNFTNLNTGIQVVQLYFSGTEIYNEGIDGPYNVSLDLYDEFWNWLDYEEYLTNAYTYDQFQPPPVLFEPPHDDYGLDTDGDGYFNYLVVNVSVNVTTAGNFIFEGDLWDQTWMIWIVFADNFTSLNTGIQTIQLYFDGSDIYNQGIDGPYNISLDLYDEFWIWLDYNEYLTNPYTYDQFDPPNASFEPPHDDYGLDTDADSYYNFLVVNVSVNVSVAGNYRVRGWLYDDTWSFVDMEANFTFLNTGIQTVQLYYDGVNIYNYGYNGSYFINLYLYDDLNNQLDSDFYITLFYNYDQFQPPPATFESPYDDYGLDTDGDGYFNYLVVNVSVNITTAGDFEVDSDLFDAIWMSWITSTFNFTFLSAGVQIIQLYFDGEDIFSSGINGPYNISLDLYDGIGAWLDYDEYLTNSYTYDQFEPPNASFEPPHDDYGLDTNGDPYYDYLIVNVSVNVTVAANYYVRGWLYDSSMTFMDFYVNFTFLNPGLQTVQLFYDGFDIYNHGDNGTYNVFLMLYDEFNNNIDSDFYTTPFYFYDQFQPPPCIFEPPHDDYGLDTDGDGYYNYLVVNVSVNITVADDYAVLDDLYDESWMVLITSTANFTYLSPGVQIIQLYFDGGDIFDSGINGPYNLSIDIINGSMVWFDYDEYLTNMYTYDQFQPPPCRFEPPYSDYGLDTDGDGYYNYLVVNVSVNITVADDYIVGADLYDESWMVGITSTGNITYLNLGVQIMQLYFDGEDIYNSGIDGPYNISLDLMNGSFVWFDYDEYLTNMYTYDQFDPPSARFEPPHDDFGLDTDGDGQYNYLIVNITVNISIPGNYYVEADLWDQFMMMWISYSDNFTFLNPGIQVVYLIFEGFVINNSGIDGPYNLSIDLYNDTWVWFDYDEYLTNPYNYDDFETPPAIFNPPHDDYGLDTDGDGLFNYLVVNVTVNVNVAGFYSVVGNLYNSSWSWMDDDSNYTFLNAGIQIVELRFNGWPIRNNGDNGSHIVELYLYNDTGFWLDSDIYLTNPYTVDQFEEPPALFFPPHTDYGLDTDGDGFYDYLVINVVVNVSEAGFYEIEGNLYDSLMSWIEDTSVIAYLDVGVHVVEIGFSGWGIYYNDINGTFTVDLWLYDLDGNTLDRDTHITQYYNYDEFTSELPASFYPPYSDYGLDMNADTFFDYLVVNVSVNVTFEADYVIFAELYDITGSTFISMYINVSHLPPGIHLIQLYFNGVEINQSGIDGPYRVQMGLLVREFSNGSNFIFVDSDGHVTQAYLASQFATTDSAPPIILATLPYDGAVDVPIATIIWVTFSESIDFFSVYNSFSYTDGMSTWTSLNGTWNWFANVMGFIPDEPFSYSTTYTFTINTTATDTFGNTLDGNMNGIEEGSPIDDYEWTFTTEGQPQIDTLDVSGTDLALGTVLVGDTDVVMLQLTLDATSGSVNLISINVDLSGTGIDTDVSAVRLYHDVDDSGTLSGPDIQLGTTQTFTGGRLLFKDLWFTVNFGTPENLLIVFDISGSATIGNSVGCEMVDIGYITIEAPDMVNPFALINSTNSIIQAISDALTVTGTDLALANVNQGQVDVEMLQLTLTAGSGSIEVTDIQVDLTGTGVDSDIVTVRLFDDVDGSGTITVGDIELVTQTFSVGTLTFSGLSIIVNSGTPEYLLIVFNISGSATVGATVGCEIDDETYITVSGSDTVNTFALINSTNSMIQGISDALTVVGVDIAPINVNQGIIDVEMLQLTLTAGSGSVEVTDIQVDLSGTGLDADVATVRLFDDVDGSGDLTVGDIELASQTFTGGTLTFSGLSIIVNSGTPENLLIVFNISGSATIGATVGCEIDDETYITVTGSDTVNPFIMINSTASTILEAPDILTVVGTDKAPSTVIQGDLEIVMEQLILTAGSKNVTVTDIMIDLYGTGSDLDVDSVMLYHDINSNGIFNSGVDVLLSVQTFSGGTLTFSGLSILIESGTPVSLLIVFNISAVATVGNTIGCEIVDETYITVVSPDTVDPITSVNSTDSTIIGSAPDILTVVGGDRAPINVNQGDNNVVMLNLTLTAGSGVILITDIQADLTGTGADADVSTVRLFDDVDDSGTLTVGDIQLATQTFSGGTLTFSGLSIMINSGTPENLLIVFDISGVSTVGVTVGCEITDNTFITVGAPDLVNAFTTINSTNSTIQGTPDDLTVVGIDTAPIDVMQGEIDVEMLQLTLTAGSGSILVTDIQVEMTGTGLETDLVGAKLYNDTDSSGTLTGSDTLLDTQTFSGGTLTFSGLWIIVNSGLPITLFIAFDVSVTAVVGGTIGCEILDDTSITVKAPDNVIAFTTINSTNSTILEGPDVLTVIGSDEAPVNVDQGQVGVVMEQLILSVGSKNVTVTSLQVDLSGTGSDSDVVAVRLYNDTDASGTLTVGDVQLGTTQTFSGGTLILSGFSLLVEFGTPEYLIIVFDINSTSMVGITVGCLIVDETYIVVIGPDFVNAFGPLNSTNSSISDAPDFLTPTGTDKAPINVNRGQTDVVMAQITLTVNMDNVTITDIIVDLSGTGADSDVFAVKLYHDVDDSGDLTVADIQLGTTQVFSGGTLTFSGLSILVEVGIPENLLIVFDIDNAATNGVTVGCEILDETYITLAGSDVVNPFGPINSTNSSIVGDITAPTITSIVLSDPSPTDAGTVTFTITFSEDMNTTINPTVTFGVSSPYDDHTITGSYTGANTWRGSFSISTSTGDGLNRISVSGAQDLAGNPMLIDTSHTFVIDTTSPSSFVGTTSPGDGILSYQTSLTFNLPFTASDLSPGQVDFVELYYRVDGGSWIKYPSTYISSPISFTATSEGYYEFYTRATDEAGNTEPAPMIADASTTVDITEPTILTIEFSDPSPVNAGTLTITITFSEDMDTSQILTVTFGQTSPYGTYNIIASSYSGDTWTGNFLIGASTGDGIYRISVSLGEDLAGNQMDDYTSAPFIIDTVLPTIAVVSPTGTDVPITTTISMTFNESMNKTAVQNAFSYTDGTTTWTIANGSVSWSGDTMTFTPDTTLAYGTQYTVNIAVGAEDLAGNGLTSEYSWTFTTIERPDVSPPTVVSVKPTETGKDVKVTTTLTITFNEPMNRTSVVNAISISPGVEISDYSWDGNTLTITFTSDLEYGTEYNVTVGTRAKDADGNALEEPYSWHFTTQEEPEEGSPMFFILLLLIIIIIVALLLWYLLMRKKEPSQEELPGGIEEGEAGLAEEGFAEEEPKEELVDEEGEKEIKDEPEEGTDEEIEYEEGEEPEGSEELEEKSEAEEKAESKEEDIKESEEPEEESETEQKAESEEEDMEEPEEPEEDDKEEEEEKEAESTGKGEETAGKGSKKGKKGGKGRKKGKRGKPKKK